MLDRKAIQRNSLGYKVKAKSLNLHILQLNPHITAQGSRNQSSVSTFVPREISKLPPEENRGNVTNAIIGVFLGMGLIVVGLRILVCTRN